MSSHLDAIVESFASVEGRKTVKDVLDRYGDPARRWYNLSYLELGMSQHSSLMKGSPNRNTMVAWLYHSYEPRGDEEKSVVAFLKDSGTLGFSFEDAEDSVIPLIMGSRPVLPASSVVGDMRISCLGQPRDAYILYSEALRYEWAFLSNEAWKLGRTAALKKLLDKKPLYYRQEFEDALAAQARENMKHEIHALEGETPLLAEA